MSSADQKNKYISLSEASLLTPYSQEHLSLRARQGKLKAAKIGRDWMTTEDWLNDYIRGVGIKEENKKNSNQKIASKYISLREAAIGSPYSQEYLSLRVRQGKLKAVKEGRNWVTNKEWLEEYIKNVSDIKSSSGEKATKNFLKKTEIKTERGVFDNSLAEKVSSTLIFQAESKRQFLSPRQKFGINHGSIRWIEGEIRRDRMSAGNIKE